MNRPNFIENINARYLGLIWNRRVCRLWQTVCQIFSWPHKSNVGLCWMEDREDQFAWKVFHMIKDEKEPEVESGIVSDAVSSLFGG